MTILDTHPILAIVRFRTPAALDEVFDAIRRGGIDLVEVTADTPGALGAVRAAAESGSPVGVGTIGTVEDARTFADAAPPSW